MDWRRQLATDLRSLRGPAGAEAITVTLSGAQADALARGLDLWATCTAPTDLPAVRVVGHNDTRGR